MESISMDRRAFVASAASAVVAAGALGTGAALAEEAAEAHAGHFWEVKPAPIAEDEVSEVVDCDVLVIGAGTAGVVAAHSAAEAGAKVIVLEKAEEFSARGHDVAAIGTKLQAELGIEVDVNLMKEYWSQITCNKTDMGLFNVWASRSGEVLDYYIERMTERGVPSNLGSLGEEASKSTNPCTREFATAIQFGEQQMTEEGEYTNHRFVRVIEEMAREEGAEFRYLTPAAQLIREGDGPVTGAFGIKEDGTYVRVNAANGVIMATGGITQATDMLKMWAPPVAQTDQILFLPPKGNTGDGLAMGMWVGAAHQKTNQATMALPSSAALGGQNSTDGRGISWMTVNLNGRRYFKETSPGPNMCHATLPQPKSMGFSIYDGNWEENILKFMPSGKDFRGKDLTGEERYAAIESDIKYELMYRADTLEELAEQMGMPAADFVAQVQRYNSYCESGVDEEFSVPAEKLFPIDTPPFYASRIRCGVLVCIYGLNCNSKAQVCDENDVPIPGLYAIGNCQGNFFTDSYPILIPGISHGRCVTFGRVLGQALAAGTEI